jgi:hypothetical protein
VDNPKALERDLTRGFNQAFDELPEGSLPPVPIKGYTVTVSFITDAPPPHEKGEEGEEEDPIVVYFGPAIALGIALVGAVAGAIAGKLLDSGSTTCTTTTHTETTNHADGSSTVTTTKTETCTAT